MPSGPPAVPAFLLTPLAPKSKKSAPCAQNHHLSPQIISVKSPAISATRYMIRMSELNPQLPVITVDGDFRIYRRNHREVIPVIMPPLK